MDPNSRMSEEEEEEEEGPAIDVHRRKFVYKVQPAQSIPSTSTIHSTLTAFKSSSSSEKYSKTTTTTVIASDGSAESILTSSAFGPQSEQLTTVDETNSGGPKPAAEQGDRSEWRSEQVPEQRDFDEGEQQQHMSFNEELIIKNAAVTSDVQPFNEDLIIEDAVATSDVQFDSAIVGKVIEEETAPVSDGSGEAAEIGGGGQDVIATFTLKLNADGLCEAVNHEEKPSGEVTQGAPDQEAVTQHGELFGNAAALLNQPDEIPLSQEGRQDHPSTVVNGLTADGQCLNGGLVNHYHTDVDEMEEKRVNIQDNEYGTPVSLISEGLPKDEEGVPGNALAGGEILSGLTADQIKLFVGLSETNTTPTIAPEQESSFVIGGLTHDGSAVIAGLSASESCRAPSTGPSDEALLPVIAGLTEDNNLVLCGYAASACLQDVHPISIIMNVTLDNEVVLSGLTETLTESSTIDVPGPGGELQQTEMPVNGACQTTEAISGRNSSPEQVPPADESSLMRRDSF